ncbi:hypothetical protein MKW98_028639 [Papaver atlanticum]|uniref:Uncharacterized protein n=1 Tax=Papaver atlanticum TaxID=357466 RepID=A0AAD4XBQ9_9MAGN|nr:hypothetical protein MKW98_028639 [Papaver atlanticum]
MFIETLKKILRLFLFFFHYPLQGCCNAYHRFQRDSAVLICCVSCGWFKTQESLWLNNNCWIIFDVLYEKGPPRKIRKSTSLFIEMYRHTMYWSYDLCSTERKEHGSVKRGKYTRNVDESISKLQVKLFDSKRGRAFISVMVEDTSLVHSRIAAEESLKEAPQPTEIEPCC